MSTIQYHQSPHPGMATGDPITNLPMDQSQPSQNEIQIVDTLFTKHRSGMDKIVLEAKDCLLIGLLFVIFSLPIVDNLIKKILPITNKSPYILVGIKAIMVMALFWLIKHFYLSRKGN